MISAEFGVQFKNNHHIQIPAAIPVDACLLFVRHMLSVLYLLTAIFCNLRLYSFQCLTCSDYTTDNKIKV